MRVHDGLGDIQASPVELKYGGQEGDRLKYSIGGFQGAAEGGSLPGTGKTWAWVGTVSE